MAGKKRFAMLLSALLLVCVLAGCSASAAYSGEKFYNAPEAADMDITEDSYGALEDASYQPEQNSLPTDRKLIKTVDIDAETEDLDQLLDQLTAEISKQGGYVESQQLYNGSASSSRNRYVQMVIRVPGENLDGLIHHFSERANVISREEDVEDVTLEYVSTETRIASLEAEIEQLLALMEKAETMSDLLEVEERLTNVRYELERYNSQMNVLKNQISYSTVHLYVTEVRQYTPVEEEKDGFWQRIGDGNLRGLENIWYGITEFAVFLFGNLPYLVIFAVLGIGGTLIGRYFYRRTKKNHPEEKQ